MYKSVVLHERRPELSREQFMHHWLNIHAPMSTGTKDLYGYTCNEVVDDVTPEGAAPLEVAANVDGIAHMWFKTKDGLVSLPKDQPSVQKWFADGPNFIGRRVRFMGEEVVIAQPRRDSSSTPKLAILAATQSSSPHVSRALETALRESIETRIAHRGVTITRILSDHASNNIIGFAVGRLEYVVEIWLREERAAKNAAAGIIDSLKANISSMRAFTTRENVIRTPISG